MSDVTLPRAGEWAIGVDTGGTFTDLFAVNDRNGETYATKVPSTPHNPAVAVIEAIERFKDERSVSSADISRFAHGTTVGTNAVLEENGAEVGLLVTKGFRAIYEVRAGTRPRGGALIDPFYQRPRPLVPQHRIEEVTERVLHDGTARALPEAAEIGEAVNRLVAKGARSIAVCYLFSFMNAKHEQFTAEVIRSIDPSLRVTLSSDILPVIREYPRIATTVLDAYVGPIMEKYLQSLERELERISVSTPRKYIIQSHGGLMRIDVGRRFPNQTLLSGPAAGVIFARRLGDLSKADNIVTFDMGGTSTDIALLGAGTTTETNRGQVGGHDVATPMLRIATLGAGGGTLGWIGPGGLLKAGPRSAGSTPGPACYGRGGTEATVTDADAFLGYIDAESLLGGRLLGNRDASVAALRRLGEPIGLDAEQTAIGLEKVITTNMALGVRLALTEFGVDPRSVMLVAMGGAGPVHACDVAKFLAIPRVLVPRYPGNACAAGLLQTDVRHVYVHSRLGTLRDFSAAEWHDGMNELKERAFGDGIREGFPPEEVIVRYHVDVRYPKQGYELTVPCGPELDEAEIRDIETRFHDLHERIYGISARQEHVEVVNLRVVSEMVIPKLTFTAIEAGAPEPPANALLGSRPVYFESSGGFVQTPIYARQALRSGNRIAGGAIVEQDDCTIVIEFGATATVDDYGNLLIDMPPAPVKTGA